MAKRHLILLLLIVCLPLAMLAWLGWRLARNEQAIVEQGLRQSRVEQLEEIDRGLGQFFEQRRRDMLELTDLTDLSPGHLRQIVRRQPRVGQIFLLDADGKLLHPNPNSTLNDTEREFLFQAEDIITDKRLVRRSSADDAQDGEVDDRPWRVRFWGPGVQLIFCRRLASGQVAGVLLERSRWMADLIGKLPATAVGEPENESASQSRIQLADSNGGLVYQWGAFEPDAEAKPAAEIPLSDPLGSWRLKYFVDQQQLAGVGTATYFSLVAALGAIGVALVVVAVFFYREIAREMREAVQRVSFVNQVSHELKTPLTNIRMYAELLETDLELLDADEASQADRHLGVIVAESQRLSRLIGNVLTFARADRRKLALRRATGRVDEVIARVIDRFRPTFAEHAIEVAFTAGADAEVRLDVDAVEQILGNLLSNVEKYASAGGHVEITSRQQGDRTTIEVVDRGPGIPAHLREQVFRPFFRASDGAESSTGTGIGLSITRRLARLHGGDVVLLDGSDGARFRAELHTPPTDSQEPNSGGTDAS